MSDLREQAARYYDLNPPAFDDAGYYRRLLPSPAATVLELGCGTGRVTLPLAESAARVHGVDHSAAMLALLGERLDARPELADRVRYEQGDITDLDIGARFDLVIAPFRVMQCLESDTELDGLFTTIARHLAPTGRAVLNVFHPMYRRDEMLERWRHDGETLEWEGEVGGDRVTIHDRRPRLRESPFVVYPELVYRRYRDGEVIDEVVHPLVMRCFWPDDLLSLVEGHGFRVDAKWGGYAGEDYGAGDELVVELVGAETVA